MYDFLLVINSNLGPRPYLSLFLRYSDLLAENRKFFSPLSFSALAGDDPFRIYKKSFTDPETKVFQAAKGENLMILACTDFD